MNIDFEINQRRQTSIIVIDNFYKNPHQIRELALSLEYQSNDEYFKGKRSLTKYALDKIGRVFETALQRRMIKWDYEVNGCFQYCQPEDLTVYHMDSQQWAAAIYLTPDAPIECGTSFLRSKKNGLRRCPESDVSQGFAENAINTAFEGGFYDKSRFEVIDQIGNIFNRCVIWDAKMIHAATQYFGNSKETARLFQIFFFDAESDE